MTLSSRHRIRNSNPGGLRPSTLPLGHGGSPQYWLSHVDGEETFFVSLKPPRPGTEPRTLAWKAAVLTTTLGPPPSPRDVTAFLRIYGGLTLETLQELFLYKPWRPKGFFRFEIVINVLVISFRFIWIPMLWVYYQYEYVYSYSAGIDFIRHNLTSTDVRLWRLKSIPALQGSIDNLILLMQCLNLSHYHGTFWASKYHWLGLKPESCGSLNTLFIW